MASEAQSWQTRFLLPMQRWTATHRRWSLVAAVALVFPLAVFMLRFGEPFLQISDAAHYIDLAYGRPAMLPFAARQLAPLVVRGISAVLHLPMERAFLAQGLLAFFVFVSVTLYLVIRSGAPRWMLAAIAGLFFWPASMHGLALPDLLYAALLSGLLLLLHRRHMFAAACMMLPLTISRESTALTLLCFLLANWRGLRWRDRGAAFGCWLAGTLIVKSLAANALPNREHISPALYMLGKMPWNFSKNFLGLDPWANLYPACANPVWSRSLHFGPLSRIGYCGWGLGHPLTLLAQALTEFGLLPLLVLWLWKGPGAVGARRAIARHPLARFAFLYGAVAFLMAGLLGDSVARLLAYGWPLFLVALPLALAGAAWTFRTVSAALAFLVISWSLSWMAAFLPSPPLLLAAVAGYPIGVLLLWKTTVPVDALPGQVEALDRPRQML